MRLALLTPSKCPWSRRLAGHLSALKNEVHLIDFQSAGTSRLYLSHSTTFVQEHERLLRQATTAVHFLKTRFRSNLRYAAVAPQLGRLCRDLKADVLLSMYGGGWAASAYLSGMPRFAVYVVGSDILLAGAVNRVISRRVLTASRVVFANGDNLAARTRAIAPRANVLPLLIGVDPGEFEPCELPREPVVVLCTRGFERVYNNAYLIEALGMLDDLAPRLRVVFSSSGSLLDEVRTLADRTLSPRMRQRVEFRGGVANDELRRLLQSAHVYTSLSRSDGTSTSLLEAFACGSFPVVTDIPANQEWIDPPTNNGLLVPLDQPAALADALRRAVNDAELRRHARSLNRELVLERADARQTTAELARRLESLP